MTSSKRNHDDDSKSKEKLKRTKKSDNITFQSLNVKMMNEILETSSNVFSLHGVPIQQIKIVGTVNNKIMDNGVLTFDLSDTSDSELFGIVIHKTSIREDIEKMIVDKEFISLFGIISKNNNQKVLLVNHIELISNSGFVALHALEVLSCNSYRTQGMKSSSNIHSYTTPKSLSFSPSTSESETSDQIIKVLQENLSIDEGLSCKDIFRYIPTIPIATIKKILEELNVEGRVYTSIDDDHYIFGN